MTEINSPDHMQSSLLSGAGNLAEGSAAQKHHPENGSRILIVDDEELVRCLFSESLSESYECATAANGFEALNLLAEYQFALAVCDVQMPGMNGIELLSKIVSDFPDVAVIMVSGVGRSQRVKDAFRLGASDYLIKPCDLDLLQLSVERALERRALLCADEHYREDLERKDAQFASQSAELLRLQAQLIQKEKSVAQPAGGVAQELSDSAALVYNHIERLASYIADLKRLLETYDQLGLSKANTSRINKVKQQISYDNLLSELGSTVAECQEATRRIRDLAVSPTFSRSDG